MGLMQRAVETYDCLQNQEKVYNLAPISHIITRADLEITINDKGEFRSASAVEKMHLRLSFQ